ncbi:hypothetical protein [uncultured Desulfobacter sp.]|uniref:hypothetical protein n=1 Tax=uncultured Desulfobacter sp. TaxID=240139 RepID=UPI002AAB35DF|nr:hypothetical protein [uncultured Desulfobacter sp.]
MGDAARVFLIGILGVSLGMSFLYLSIKITGKGVTALESKKKARETDGQEGNK